MSTDVVVLTAEEARAQHILPPAHDRDPTLTVARRPRRGTNWKERRAKANQKVKETIRAQLGFASNVNTGDALDEDDERDEDEDADDDFDRPAHRNPFIR